MIPAGTTKRRFIYELCWPDPLIGLYRSYDHRTMVTEDVFQAVTNIIAIRWEGDVEHAIADAMVSEEIGI